jgi:hypothetical protein
MLLSKYLITFSLNIKSLGQVNVTVNLFTKIIICLEETGFQLIS